MFIYLFAFDLLLFVSWHTTPTDQQITIFKSVLIHLKSIKPLVQVYCIKAHTLHPYFICIVNECMIWRKLTEKQPPS